MRKRVLLGSGLACLLVVGALTFRAHAKVDEQAQIRAFYKDFVAAIDAKDVDSIMKFYVPAEDLVLFDVIPPLQYVGADAVRKDWQGFLGGLKTIKVDVVQLNIVASGKLAFARYIQPISAVDTKDKPMDMTLRVTDCLRKIKGKWVIVHQHVSVPVDMMTGKPEMALKP